MAGNEIEMTIEAVRSIANSTMEQLRGKAEGSTRTLGNVRLPASAFGGWPRAQALGRHHESAHDVFVRTLEGVIADLEAFAQNLRDTADSTERRDEEVEADLVALGRGYSERTFQSRANYSAAVEEHSGRAGVDAGTLAEEAAAIEAGAVETGPVGTGAESGAVGGQEPPADASRGTGVAAEPGSDVGGTPAAEPGPTPAGRPGLQDFA